MQSTILTTGRTPYVGALVCQELSLAGWNVRWLDCLFHARASIMLRVHTAPVETIGGKTSNGHMRR